ncbi:MAG: TonB family protein [Candidimonas sp.]|nr:MAG: TonB family protein [Candidimonas sp.]
MALIKCDECGATVSNKAVACPKCGNPLSGRRRPSARVTRNYATNPPKKSAISSILILVFALFVIVLIVHRYSDMSDSPTQQQLPAADTSPTPTGVASTPTPATSFGVRPPSPAPAQASDNDNNYAAKVAACVRPGVIYPLPTRAGANPTLQYKANLDAQGHVTHVQVQRSSGIAGFDRAVARGIQNCSPFPMPPSGRYPAYITGDYRMYGNGQGVSLGHKEPTKSYSSNAPAETVLEKIAANGGQPPQSMEFEVVEDCKSAVEETWNGYGDPKFSFQDKLNTGYLYEHGVLTIEVPFSHQNVYGAKVRDIAACTLKPDGTQWKVIDHNP